MVGGTKKKPKRKVCCKCHGLGGTASRYGPPPMLLPDGRLSGWTMGGKKDCKGCDGTGFEVNKQ